MKLIFKTSIYSFLSYYKFCMYGFNILVNTSYLLTYQEEALRMKSDICNCLDL